MKLQFTQVAWKIFPFLVPLLLLLILPRPKAWGWRAVIAALGTSVAWILFTTEVYHPLYHAVSWQRGENPNVLFDSDHLDGVKYFLGWIVPAGVVAITAAVRFVVQRLVPSVLSGRANAA